MACGSGGPESGLVFTTCCFEFKPDYIRLVKETEKLIAFAGFLLFSSLKTGQVVNFIK